MRMLLSCGSTSAGGGVQVINASGRQRKHTRSPLPARPCQCPVLQQASSILTVYAWLPQTPCPLWFLGTQCPAQRACERQYWAASSEEWCVL
jgi:hypothetical protein